MIGSYLGVLIPGSIYISSHLPQTSLGKRKAPFAPDKRRQTIEPGSRWLLTDAQRYWTHSPTWWELKPCLHFTTISIQKWPIDLHYLRRFNAWKPGSLQIDEQDLNGQNVTRRQNPPTLTGCSKVCKRDFAPVPSLSYQTSLNSPKRDAHSGTIHMYTYIYCLANSVYNIIIHYTPLCKRALVLYWIVWFLGWVLFGKIDCFFQALITVYFNLSIQYISFMKVNPHCTCALSNWRIVLSVLATCLKLVILAIFRHFQARRQWSPRVAKVQGGPQGLLNQIDHI